MNSFPHWWQHLPDQLNPTIFSVFGFPIRWYGTMYIVAIVIVYLLVNYRIRSEKLPYSQEFTGNVITYAVFGLMIGGRLGYILFYDLSNFIENPISTISPIAKTTAGWKLIGISGMSYHGGVIGVTSAFILFAFINKMRIYKISDLLVPAIPLGFTFGRIGNFINGELFGRVTDTKIGMYFPAAGDGLLRHPSQLYEAFFEGLVLFAILWPLRKKNPFNGFLTGLYVFGYGFFRFFIEYFRQPDAHLGFVFMDFSMGQVLCFFMMLTGGIIWYTGWRTDLNSADS